MTAKAPPELLWLVTPRTHEGVTRLELHAVRGGVTLCRLSARTCACFQPEAATPPEKRAGARRCSACTATAKAEVERARAKVTGAPARIPPRLARFARPPGYSTALELLSVAKITYRQLDHWTSLGYLVATAANPGTGGVRFFSPAEVMVAARMAAMVGAGLTPLAASKAARNGGQLGRGVRIVVEGAA